MEGGRRSWHAEACALLVCMMRAARSVAQGSGAGEGSRRALPKCRIHGSSSAAGCSGELGSMDKWDAVVRLARVYSSVLYARAAKLSLYECP